MLGLMQDWPLLCHRVIDHAARNHAERPVISRSVEGPIHTTNYSQVRARALKVAQCLRSRRHPARRPGGDAGLEHLAASRSLVRHHRHRRDLPHGQPAAVSRADCLDRQPRRRSRADGRPHLRPADREARRQASLGRALHHPHRRRAHAGDVAAQRGGLRGMDRRSRRRFRLEDVRREHRRRHVLHLRHHRQSEGRALLAPLERAALDDGERARRHGRSPAATWCCRSCRCSTPIAGGSRSPPRCRARHW